MLATACGAPPCPCARSRLLPSASIGICYGSMRVCSTRRRAPRRAAVVRCGLLPVDPWAPTMVDSQSVASQLFAVSLFPYLGFLYFMTRSKTAPGLTLFGFYFLLAFVGATKNYHPARMCLLLLRRSLQCSSRLLYHGLLAPTAAAITTEQLSMSVPLIVFILFHAPVFIPGAVPAGIYAKVHYGTSLSNVDWLHGSAESLLTLTNLFIVLGLRGALRKLEEEDTKEGISEAPQDSKEKSSV